MIWESPFVNLIKKSLPPEAVLIRPLNPYGAPSVQISDMNGDGKLEIVAAYRLCKETYVLIAKECNNKLSTHINIKGPGHDVNYLGFADITGDGRNDLLIGWQTGDEYAELQILSWDFNRIRTIVNGIQYSLIEIDDLPSEYGRDGKKEVVLWKRINEDAFLVEILRWDGRRLVPVDEIYPSYFDKVISYFENKANQKHKNALYYYCFADAQIKAGNYQKALNSIKEGMSFKDDCLLKKEFMLLKKKALSHIRLKFPGLYPAPVNDVGGIKWGYIDNAGKFAIKPVYHWAQSFQQNGLAVVTIDGLSGIIDASGNYIVEPQYYDIGDFSEGRAILAGDNGFKAIDERGNIIFRSDGYIGRFQNGRADFAGSDINGKILYGYIDRYGNIAIEPVFESTSSFKDGKAVVKLKDGTYAVIGVKGEIKRKFSHFFVGDINEGLLSFKEKEDGNYGFINENGNVIIPPRYAGVEGFKNGRAIVNTSCDCRGKFGLIDRRGRFVIDAHYNSMQLLGEGLLAVGIPARDGCVSGQYKYAVAHIDGTLLTDFIYYGITPYKNDFASAYDECNTFFIDKTGKKVSGMPVFKGIGSAYAQEGVIIANIDNRISYLDKTGDIIWTQNSEISLGEKYTLKEVKYRPNRNYLMYYPQIFGMGDNKLQTKVNRILRQIALNDSFDGDLETEYSYEGEFNIDLFRKDLLVLRVYGYKNPFGTGHGIPRKDFIHLNLKSGSFYGLKDLFRKDSNYMQILRNITSVKIKEQGYLEGFWQEHNEETEQDMPFYVTEDALHLYFHPYEAARYSAVFPEFEIPFDKIIDIVDTEGEFWNSFN